MSQLRILMADDHEQEIEEARRALKDLNHKVTTATTFEQALEYARTGTYDIAVIDLGWFTDHSLVSEVGTEDAGAGGWDLLKEVKRRNPDTVRILYSARTETTDVAHAAAKEGVYCIKKRFSPDGRRNLAEVVKVIADRLSCENELRERVEHLGTELERTRTDLEQASVRVRELEGEERRFRRVLFTVVALLVVAFALFVLTWVLTQQLLVTLAASTFGVFLVLAALRATGNISPQDLRVLLRSWQTLRKP